jgi:hypothetical protein
MTPQDPMKIKKSWYRDQNYEWFQNVFLSRANNKEKSRFVLCTARMHHDDLTNRFLMSNKEENFLYENIRYDI